MLASLEQLSKFLDFLVQVSASKTSLRLHTMSTVPIAIPGQDLGPVSKYIPGPGTHIHNLHVYASVLGLIHVTTPPKSAGPSKRLNKITTAAPAPLPTISVIRSPPTGGPASETGFGPGPKEKDETQVAGAAQVPAKGKAEVLPEVNSVVLCRVTRITPRQATVAILVVGETVLDGEWQGLIRVQDVRATEKDRVKIFESFRPGDIVRASVVSYLSLCGSDGKLPCAIHHRTKDARTDISWRSIELLSFYGQKQSRCHYGDQCCG